MRLVRSFDTNRIGPSKPCRAFFHLGKSFSGTAANVSAIGDQRECNSRVRIGPVRAGRRSERYLPHAILAVTRLEAVQSALKESTEGYIYDDSDKQYFQNEVSVFDRSEAEPAATVAMPESNWTALSAAREKLRTRLSAIKSLSPKEVDAFYTAAEILVEPSVSYDSVATESGSPVRSSNPLSRAASR